MVILWWFYGESLVNTRLEAPVGHIEVDVAVKQAQRGAEMDNRPPFEQEEFKGQQPKIMGEMEV